MAVQYNILERYGIKEVADVVFIDIATDRPVLYLDSLKVSTIEETAENTEARGGKGNAPLLSWDYGKEINVTITDALYSPKSLTLMHTQNLSDLHVYNPGMYDSSLKSHEIGIKKYKNLYVNTQGYIEGDESKTKASALVAAATSASGAIDLLKKIGVDDREAETIVSFEKKIDDTTTVTNFINIYRAEDNEYFDASATGKKFHSIEDGQVYIVEYEATPAHKSELKINADTFPGTYKVVGDTYARNNRTGKDDFFQFVIPKAKMNPETTITLEAEGDPTVFDMSLKVLRPNDGVMMKLIQYDFNDVDNGDNTGNAVNVHFYANDKENTELYPAAGTAGPEGTKS